MSITTLLIYIDNLEKTVGLFNCEKLGQLMVRKIDRLCFEPGHSTIGGLFAESVMCMFLRTVVLMSFSTTASNNTVLNTVAE